MDDQLQSRASLRLNWKETHDQAGDAMPSDGGAWRELVRNERMLVRNEGMLVRNERMLVRMRCKINKNEFFLFLDLVVLK